MSMKKTYYTAGGELLAEKSSGGQRVDYLTDALGSVRATLDQAGSVVNRYAYKPYGALLSKSGTGADPSFGWVGSLGYRQTGRNYSDVYVRARHYDSTDGRWTTKDPIGFGGGDWNVFRYVGGMPTLYIDPTGLDPIAGSGKYITCCEIYGPPNPASNQWMTVRVKSYKLFGSTRNFATDLARANDIYDQCCIHVKLAGSVSYDERTTREMLGGLELDVDVNPPATTPSLRRMTRRQTPATVIHSYLVLSFLDENFFGSSFPSPFWQLPPAESLAIVNKAPWNTLAHEMGHILLKDPNHYAGDPLNLMTGGGDPARYKLMEGQCDKIRQNPLVG